ncbi:MAG: DUF4870 domain-containing protein [Planctomycetia bacterium]|jgi:uncharacterized Tic20 family protein
MSYEPQNPTPNPNESDLDPNTRLLGSLIHLAGFAGFILKLPPLGPLVFWLIVKDRHVFLDNQGKEATNFQISCTIYAVVIAILGIITFGYGFLLLIPLWAFWAIFSIIAALKANSGEWYTYPLIIRLVK